MVPGLHGAKSCAGQALSWKAKPNCSSSAPARGGRPTGTAGAWGKPQGNHTAAAGGAEGAAGGTAPWSRVALQGVTNHSNIGQILLLRLPVLNPAGAGGPHGGLGGAISPMGAGKQGLTCKDARDRRWHPADGFPPGKLAVIPKAVPGQSRGTRSPKPLSAGEGDGSQAWPRSGGSR